MASRSSSTNKQGAENAKLKAVPQPAAEILKSGLVKSISEARELETSRDRIVRFGINLSEDFARIAQDTAERRGVTVTDVFRRALSMMDAIDQERAKGNNIESVDAKGNVVRLVFL